MPIGPRPDDVPRVLAVLKVYRVSAIVTGVFLLLLVALVIIRIFFQVDIELNGPDGFLALQQRHLITGIDLTTAILIVHGWLYVLYLACDFLLWRFTRFSFLRFLYFALGGIIPLLSFYFEFRLPAFVREQLAATEARSAATAAATTGAAA